MPSKDPIKLRTAQVRYKTAHRDEINARKRMAYRANTAKHHERSRLYRLANPDKVKPAWNAYQRKRRARIISEMLSQYGACCRCCGEANPYFLEIDHINGGGNAHRRLLNIGNGLQFYEWLRRNNWPKDEYQLLCANCNKGKARNGGVCPHQ